jgi:tetratricopeptide (TPR) repeat protein
MFTLWGSADSPSSEYDEKKKSLPLSMFCGFSDAFDSFREETRDEESLESPSKKQEKYREEPDNILQECYDDVDDATVVSSSGASTLSIDYNGSRNLIESGKVDLSDIGDDDDSTIGSELPEDDNTNKHQESREGFENMKRLLQHTSKPLDDISRSNRPSLYASREKDQSADTKMKQLHKTLNIQVSSHGRYSVEVAQTLKDLGILNENCGKLNDALKSYKESLEIYSSKLGDHSSEVIGLELCIGRVYYHLGNDDEALKFYCRVLSMMSNIKGDYDIGCADSRVFISKIIHSKGFHKEAIKELKKALKSYRQRFGDEHTNVAETVDLIADFYTSNGNHDKAASVRGELVKLRVALHGAKSVEVARALEKWAFAHEAHGDLTAALSVMKQSYVMLHDIEGADGPNAESSLEKIGFLYSKMGRIDKGIKAHTSVALLRKQKYGEYSVELASSYLTLGKAYMKASQHDRALKALNRAMTCYGKANEENNSYISEIMETLHTIGTLHYESSNYTKALDTFEKEKKIRQRYMKRDYTGITNSIISIGKSQCALSNFTEGKKYFVEALRRCDRFVGRTSEFGENLMLCAKAFEGLNDEEHAFTCFKESYQIFLANGCDKDFAPLKEAALKLRELGLKDISTLNASLRCQVVDGESQKFEF